MKTHSLLKEFIFGFIELIGIGDESESEDEFISNHIVFYSFRMIQFWLSYYDLGEDIKSFCKYDFLIDS
jgi:hypothetical protein